LTLNVSTDDFTLSKQTIDSLAVDGEDSFTVVPNGGLSVGPHTATVSVTGGNGGTSAPITASFGVSFEVKPVPVYGIELNISGTHTFPDAILGYPAQAVKTVTISNTGNQPTENLTLSVSNGDFVLDPTTIANIAVKDEAPFTVVPALGLSKGTHTATVTVSGANGINASFNVSFEVTASYGITLNPTAHTFPEAIFGYGAQEVKTVNISNTGDQPTGVLAVALTGVNPSAFTLDPPTTVASIAAGTAGSFTVAPALGLSKGTHTATVTVSGGNGIFSSFNVSFEVTATYGITLDVEGDYPFPGAILGYPAQTAKTINIGNTGNQPTGALTLDVSNTDFTLDPPTTVASIGAGTAGSFTVVPKTGLAVGTHSATVTVGGFNGINAAFSVSFEVTATYGIELGQTETLIFDEAIFGYPAQGAKTVIISNTGNQPTGNLTVSAGAYFEVTTPENGAVSSIPVGETATFSVRPKIGLSEGTHTATVTVSGIGGTGASNIEPRSFDVSFEVTVAFASIVTRMAEDKNIPSATYTLSGGEETWTDGLNLTTANCPATVVIDGGGRIITGGTNSITVGAGLTLTLRNITFTTIPLTVAASGTLVLETGAVVRDNAGTGITVSGTLEMNAGALVTANNASGIRMNGTGARFTMDGGTVSYNTSDSGGGVRIDGGEFTMNNGLISENHSTGYGGGVLLIGGGCTVTMKNGEISNNRADNGGGGVVIWRNANLVFNMEGGLITGNYAYNWGGGLYTIYGGVFNLTGGDITGNSARVGGGGIYISSSTLNGNFSIGEKVDGKCSMYGNLPQDLYWP
jgi:uncharacterized membrane protein